jgi:cyclase
MLRPRVIPTLLLESGGVIKTIRFRSPRYIGDPINVVRLFNDMEVDELVLLDVAAEEPNLRFLGDLTDECFMPVCYGGGVGRLADMDRLFALGIEKVALNAAAVRTPELVRQAADAFGSQSVVVSIDVARNWRRRPRVVIRRGTRSTGLDPVTHARRMENEGAGEILLNSVDRDGTMSGYDLDLVREVAQAVHIPVIACGGAGHLDHVRAVLREGGAAGAAAGSLFIYSGPHRGILVSYPQPTEIAGLLA